MTDMVVDTVQRRANRRLGIKLGLLALMFGLAFVAKVVWFGG